MIDANVKSKMRSTTLWIFPLLLATTNGIRCYVKESTSCALVWGDNKLTFFKCLENLNPTLEECGSESSCVSLNLTFADGHVFLQRSCASTDGCKTNDDTLKDIVRLETMTKIIINKIECGSCNSDSCNVTHFDIKDYGTICYWTEMSKCYHLAIGDHSEEMKEKRIECLKETKPFRCGIKHLCYWKFHRFHDNTMLIEKGCNSKYPICPADYEASVYFNLIGKNMTQADCEYCEGYLCNKGPTFRQYGYMLQCWVTHYQECFPYDRHYTSLSKKGQTDAYNCLKNLPKYKRDCPDLCVTMLIIFHDRALAFRDCNETFGKLGYNKSLIYKEIKSLTGKEVLDSIFTYCDKNECNDKRAPPLSAIRGTGPYCYQSDLFSCIDKMTLIVSQESLFDCVEKMNQKNETKLCKKNENCTTVSFQFTTGEPIYYLTCGTGPKGKCERLVSSLDMEKYIGKTLIQAKCDYCEEDYCNNNMTNNPPESSESIKRITCFVSDFTICEKMLPEVNKKPSHTELKKKRKKIYDCFKGNPPNKKICQGCLKVTFIFEDQSFQSGFCENPKHKARCEVPMDKEYFFKYTRKILKHTQCEKCTTNYCNNFTMSSRKKSVVVSLATYQVHNFSLILILFISNFDYFTHFVVLMFSIK